MRRTLETSTGRDEQLSPPIVMSASTCGVVKKIDSCGGDLDSILGRAHIQASDLGTPHNELYLTHFCRLFEEAAKQTGNNNFGLQFGNTFKPKQLGALGYAAISSPTLFAGLKNMETFFPAHQSKTSFRLSQADDIIWLSYRIMDEQIIERRQDAELSLGMFCNVLRHCLGENWTPLEMHFEHRKPHHPKEHERLYNAPVYFGRQMNAIAFRRADLDVNMPTHDPYLLSTIEPLLRSQCEINNEQIDFAEAVRNEIMLNIGDRAPTISELSSIFGFSEPSFQRRLKAHNLTFKDLLKSVRQDLATRYLKNPDIQITEIAYLLGYSETSAFSRAFCAWTGMPPHHYRKNALQPDQSD